MTENRRPGALSRLTVPGVSVSGRLTLIAYYGLILSLFFNSLAMTTGLTVTTLVFWLLQSLPLLPFAPGLHRGRVRYHAWLSFVVLMYFVHAVLSAFTPGKLGAGLAGIFFSTLLFVALILFIRSNARSGGHNKRTTGS